MPNILQPRLIRSSRKTLVIEITPIGEVVIKAPLRTSINVIQQFFHQNQTWITEHLARMKTNRSKLIDKEGESFLFLGKPYRFTLVNTTEIAVYENELRFPRVLLFRAEKELMSWYIKQAETKILQRLRFFAIQMKASYGVVTFSDTRSQWGRCSHDNSLQFSWRLIMAPLMVLDYVVIHELAHTTQKNHSRSFWNRVRLFTPAYKQHQKWLETHGHLLAIRPIKEPGE